MTTNLVQLLVFLILITIIGAQQQQLQQQKYVFIPISIIDKPLTTTCTITIQQLQYNNNKNYYFSITKPQWNIIQKHIIYNNQSNIVIPLLQQTNTNTVQHDNNNYIWFNINSKQQYNNNLFHIHIICANHTVLPITGKIIDIDQYDTTTVANTMYFNILQTTNKHKHKHKPFVNSNDVCYIHNKQYELDRYIKHVYYNAKCYGNSTYHTDLFDNKQCKQNSKKQYNNQASTTYNTIVSIVYNLYNKWHNQTKLYKTLLYVSLTLCMINFYVIKQLLNSSTLST